MGNSDHKSSPIEHRRFSLHLPRSPWFVLAAIVVIIASSGIRYGLSAYHQQNAINEIKRDEGNVWVELAGPAWFQRFQADRGLSGFGTVKIVTCCGDDEAVARLQQFRGLKRLHLDACRFHKPITNLGLGNLSQLRNLNELWVAGDFDDESLASLSGLTGLRRLVLYSPNVTDRGIPHLAPLGNLEWLDLNGTKVTEGGLTRLRKALPKAQVEKFEGTYHTHFPGEEHRSWKM